MDELLYRVEVEYEGRVRRSNPVSFKDAMILQALTQIGGIDEVRIVPDRKPLRESIYA